MIDSKFRNINRLLVLPFKNDEDDPTRNYFNMYYMSLVEMKDFNALLYIKSFFGQPV